MPEPKTFPPPPNSDAIVGEEKPAPVWARWFQLLQAIVKNLVDLDSEQTLTNKTITNATDDTRCYVFARRTSQQSLTSGAYPVINFDTVDVDTRSAVTTGASWKFTVPTGHGGVYSVATTICLAAGTSGILAVGLFKNGTEVWRLARTPASALAMTHSSAAKVKLVAGDYIDIRAYQDSGVARNINEGAGSTLDVQCQVAILREVTDL